MATSTGLGIEERARLYYLRVDMLRAYSRDVSNVRWDSVASCLRTADSCHARFLAGDDMPTGCEGTWFDAAERWVTRAGEHAFGFALPTWWGPR